VLLLENLRFHKEETAGDPGFAKQLAKLGDCYVNDAFGTAHRDHASTSVIAAEFPGQAAFGLLMEKEITQVDHVLKHAKSPSLAIVGGAKVSSKIDILDRLIDQVDGIVIGGGMSFTFIKALGGKVGNSLVEDDYVATARRILDRAESKGVRIHLPVDVVAGDAFDNEAKRQVCLSDKIPDGWMGLDIGPQAIKAFSQAIQGAQTLLWNGPMGVFEMPNFSQGTRLVGEAIATATTSRGAYSLVGGGDSVAAAAQFNLADRVSYVSTGGGAMLEYLEGKTLPGIQAVWDAMDTNDHTH
jgi:phosphoglycerate kinase